MVVQIKIHNEVIISSIIDEKMYHQFIGQLSLILNSHEQSDFIRCQGDYSDVFTLDNNQSDEHSVLVPTTRSEWVHGSVEDLVNWLRLVDIFVLRPHGYYFIDQHLNFNEFYNSSDPIVVTLTENNGNLKTKFYWFQQEEIDRVSKRFSIVPLEMWLLPVNKLTGHNLMKYVCVDNKNNDDDDDYMGEILKFFGPSDPEGFIIQKRVGEQSQFHYKPDFNLETFMNPVDINMILEKLSRK